ncbi:MAG: hypothetical protein ABI972_08655 [Acidobacteriota bacterium]
MTAALLTLVYLMLLFDGGHRLFRDSDSGWHIRTGEHILASAALPRVDTYSFGKPGAKWVAWEWGADVAMGAMHRFGGLGAVAWVYMAAIALCTWLWFQLQWQLETNFLIACALASPMLSTANIHWLARPHVFGWVLLLTALLWLERDAAKGRARAWWVWAAMGAVWANAHASFFLLPVIAAFFIPRLGWGPVVAAAAGTFLNPYGWELHEHVARYLADRELLRLIGEFQSFNFHSDGAAQIALAVLLAATGVGMLLQRGEFRRASIALFFCAIALRSARGLPLLALASLPFAGRALSRLAWPQSFVQYGVNLRAIDGRFAGWLCGAAALTVSLVLMNSAWMQPRSGFPENEFPVKASAYISQLPEGARLFAPDKFGGYLIYRFDGQRRVFFDGRSDYYGAAFLKDYIAMVQVRPGWKAIWQRFGFTHAVMPLDYSLNSVMGELGWRERYRDSTVVVWAQP